MDITSRLKRINEKDIAMKPGFCIVSLLAVLGMLFQLLRGFQGMEAAWAISTGIEILGLAINSVVFFGFLRNKETGSHVKTVFAALIITSSLSLFWDECAWLVQGVARFAVFNRMTNAFLYVNSFTMEFMFWGYLVNAFKIKTRLADITTQLLIILWFPLSIASLLNIFFPIFFIVDSSGMYQRTPLYFVHLLYFLFVIPVAAYHIIKAKVTTMEKTVAATFFIFPAVGEIISFFYFGISTAPMCFMMSTLINYCVIISSREKKFLVTQNGLAIASSIQMGMLPVSKGAFPDRDDFDISASMTPAQTVGGDFYDFFLLDDDHLAILIADVSDKGIPAALFMTVSKVFMKTCIQMGGTPSEIVTYADERISAENDAGMFVTLWFGIIDLKTGHVDACNAGHDYPAISKLSEGYKVEKTPHGPPIAFMPGMTFPDISFDLKPGESIFLYTDGLVEAKRADNDRFGTDRMLEVLNSCKAESGDQLIEAMKEAVGSYVDGEPQFDDMTMLSFTYKGR